MSRIMLSSLVAVVSVATVLAAAAFGHPQGRQGSAAVQTGYTPAAIQAMGARWDAYAAHYAGPARTSASRSAYTPAAVRALGARWEAYAAWYRAQSTN